MLEVLSIICSSVTMIIVAYINYRAVQDRKKNEERDKKTDEIAVRREKESRLSMKMMDATLQLSVVTANAVLGGHNNGNVEKAKQAAEEARAQYLNFLQDIASHEVAK